MGNLEIGLESDTQVGIGNISFNIKTTFFISAKVQLVAMSATIGNLHEVASFLDAKLYTGNFRPVTLSEYVKVRHFIYLFY